MKNIYYGNKQTIFPTENFYYLTHLRKFCHEIGWLWKHGDSILNSRKESLEKDLERLRNGERLYSYIVDKNRIDNKEILILEKEHDHENEIGEDVEIGKYKGKITDRRYDANTNIMYYYTDVVVIKNNADNYDEQCSKAIMDVLGKLEEMYEHYFKPTTKNEKDEVKLNPIYKPLKRWYQFWK